MDVILDLIEGFFTWHTPISFLAGIGTHHLYCKYIRDREATPAMFIRKRADGDHRLSTKFWAIASVTVLLIGFIGWRTQDTADRVDDQSMLTRDCLTQVITALTVARTINNENDELSTVQRNAYAVVLQALVAPPEPYYSMSMDDPRRAEYLTDVGIEQLKLVKATQSDEQANIEYRTAHPYPDPDCAILKRE